MTIIVILIGAILIFLNIDIINKEKYKDDNENNFKGVLEVTQDNINDYDIKLFEIRKEYAENITELQCEVEELKKLVIQLSKQNDKVTDNKKSVSKKENKDDSNIHKKDKNQQDEKTEKIIDLIKLGKSDDEICKKTGVAKGEILLIRRLINI